jgi:hypothetical protein
VPTQSTVWEAFHRLATGRAAASCLRDAKAYSARTPKCHDHRTVRGQSRIGDQCTEKRLRSFKSARAASDSRTKGWSIGGAIHPPQSQPMALGRGEMANGKRLLTSTLFRFGCKSSLCQGDVRFAIVRGQLCQSGETKVSARASFPST